MMAVILVMFYMLSLVMQGLYLAHAAEDRKNVQIVVSIKPRVSLSIDKTQLTFAGYEDQAVILAQEGPVQITARGRATLGKSLTLTIRGESDLNSPSGRIPIQQVHWTARGEGLRNGTLDSTNQHLVGLWATGGVHKGQLNFAIENKGRLIPGDYEAQVVFTLSSP